MRVFCLLSLVLLLSGCGRKPIERIEWMAMGTVAAVQMRGASAEGWGSIGWIVAEKFAEVIDEFDVHDPKSAICRLGTCTPFGRPCMQAALKLRDQSGGAFNPRWRTDGRLDFGAIAKGFAVDVAAGAVTNISGEVLIDLGGNLKSVRGSWQVGIAGSDTVITLTNQMACATSAEYFRGKHIYDGRTGLAVTNDVRSVTVVHPTSAMLADGLSTTLYVLGRDEGEKFLKRHYPEAKAIWIMKK